MRLPSETFALLPLLTLPTAPLITEAAGSRSSRSRSGSSRSGSSRYAYSYRSRSGPIYSRRLSVSVMGALYFGYATRYPSHFSYRKTTTFESGTACVNNMALENGSHIGSFLCPFLPDEASNWTRCCGYDDEGFCCDPSYDDSWKHSRLSVPHILLTVCGILLGVSLFGFFICAAKKRSNRTRDTAVVIFQVQHPGASASAQQVGADVKHPLEPPPYPVAVAAGAVTNSGFEPPQYSPSQLPPNYEIRDTGGVRLLTVGEMRIPS